MTLLDESFVGISRYITNPISLVAYAAALLTLFFITRKISDRNKLKANPKAYVATAERLNIDFSLIPEVERTKVTMKILSNRIKTLFIIAFAILAGGIIIAYVAVSAMPKTPNTHSSDKKSNLKGLSILVHGNAGVDDLIMKSHGFVIMHINGAGNQEPIDYRGSAKFSNLRIGDSFRLTVMDSEPYTVRKPDSFYILDNQTEIPLEVYLKGVNRIFGYVRYKEEPMPAARVSFDMLDAPTDSLGRFVLNIPDSLQRQSYQINAYKKGFKSTTATAYPESSTPVYINLERR